MASVGCGRRKISKPFLCRHSLDMAQRRRTLVGAAGVGVAVMLLLVVVIPVTLGCNIDTREPYVTFNSDQHGQPGSYFGYTVLQHQNNQGWWVLVGAPRGSSSQNNRRNAEKPGTVWMCSSNPTITQCLQVAVNEPRGTSASTLRNQGIVDNPDNGWMGVSLTSQTNQLFGEVTVCAHRFGNDFVLDQPNANLSDFRTDRLVQGLCYSLDPELYETRTRFNPCAREDAFRDGIVENETTRWQGWCQFGMSASYTVEDGGSVQTVVAGAPGSYDWTGTTFKATGTGANMVAGELNDWNSDYSYEDFYQYVGYSTSVGNFMSTTTQQGASGAPRAGGLVGKVYIHDLETFQVYQELQGEMMNTYFGGAVEALDINNDGLYDLLVGAPLYSVDQDEGRVYVYINRGGDSPLQLHQRIDGTSTPGSRFGQVITTINDLNKDNFPDVAIGAPYEGGGAVYIYPCTERGIDEAYSQRIDGRETDPTVYSFGSSISGGQDFDGNNYPDIAIGAYANDSIYLYKTRPLLDLLVNLTVTPDPMDPENPSCIDSIGPCLKIEVCFNYRGPTPASLPESIEVIYDLEVDKVKTGAGFKPRFLLDNGTMISKISPVKKIFRYLDTCFNYTAYLQGTATDFLSPMPVDLTYILMNYEVEPPQRGDKPYRFPGGLAPVMKSYQCASITKNEDVNFVRDCGVDAVCETDIRLEGSIEIEGDPTEIIVGGPSKAYLQARIDNVGEEAHQAFLTINHPIDMRYEGVEINELSCIDANGNDLIQCDEKQTLVTCEPTQVNFDTSSVSCNLGNPMRSFTASTLRLRFDIGGLIYVPERQINIEVIASTSSLQTPESLPDNTMEVNYLLVVEADIGIFGSTTPESVEYSSNSSNYADAASAQKSLEAAVNMALTEPTSPTFNDTIIGAPFTLSYRITNDGAGMLPFQSVLTINIPWRMINGDWLVFIKSISVTDSTGTGTCNSADIIELQNERLLEKYVDDSRNLQPAPEEDITPIYGTVEDVQHLGCTKAKCVALTCHINPLQVRHILEVRIQAIQWEHTYITRELGYVEVLTEAQLVAQMDDGYLGQGEDVNPDRIQLPVKMFTNMKGTGTVPIWVIILSILGGLLLLFFLILLLWKCGFFKRKTREDWQEEIDGGAPPAPIKPPVAPTGGELDGADLPMMKGPAAKE